MKSNEADNDEGLTEDRPFSPLYPVLNFGTPTTYIDNDFSESAPPPPYNIANHQYVFPEKKTL